MYGQVTVDGKNFIERIQTFTLEQDVTSNGQILQGSLVLPGVANFRLKGLTRAVLKSHAPSTACPFKFRLGNSDGNTWYSQGGNSAQLGSNSPVGGSTDRVLDSLIFGNGQFPFPLTVPIFYGASSSIKWEIEDCSNNAPYTIYFGFQGAYLIPQ
jgi:hypothetical protein